MFIIKQLIITFFIYTFKHSCHWKA